MGGSFVISICTNQEKGQSMQVGTKIVHMQTSCKPNPQNMLEPKLGKKITSFIFSYSIFCEQQWKLYYSGERCCTILDRESWKFLILPKLWIP